MKPFSVVIISYNEEEHLPVLLDSIQKQSLQPYEVIVADAKSEDRTVEIALDYGARVVQGGRPSRGRNLGAKAAQTDHIIFFDADVCLEDDCFFEKAWEDFVKKTCDLATVDVQPRSSHRWDRFSHWVYNKYVRLWGDRHPHAPGFCIFTKKDLHDRIGGFDEQIDFCEDHEYAARAVKHGARFRFLDHVSVPVSVRRMDRDGRLNIAVKYLLGELHFLFVGPIRHKKFNYTFGYGKHREK